MLAQVSRAVELPPTVTDAEIEVIEMLASSGVCLVMPDAAAAERSSPVFDVVSGGSVDTPEERERRALRLLRAVDVRREQPRVSVLLATKRPGAIENAIRLVSAQRGVIVELVLGLHGSVWDSHSESDLENLGRICTVVTRVPDAATLGGVLNAATARATAPVVSKWDDDDWYGPEHLSDLTRALEYSEATLVGKGAEFVFLEGSDMTVRRDSKGGERFSDRLAGGTLTMRRADLERVGRWPDVRRHVDLGLIRAVHQSGGSTYRIHGMDYLLHRRSGDAADHTWAADDGYFASSADRRWTGHRIDKATS